MARKVQPKKQSALPAKFKNETLPFYELTETPFEECCRWLCRVRYPQYDRYELKRKRGLGQFGVDVECFTTAGYPETVLSAKCYHDTSVTGASIADWVEDFTKHLDGHWKGRKVKRFILAITKDGNSDSINDAIREQHKLLKSLGIEFVPWLNKDLHEIAKKDPELVQEFFELAWSARIYPDRFVQYLEVGSGSSQIGLSGNNLTDEQIEGLKKQASKSVADLLEIHIQARRYGDSEPLQNYLDTIDDQSTDWKDIPAAIKARIWRLRASLVLDDRDYDKAQAFLDKSISYEQPPNNVLPTLISYHRDGVDNALQILNESSEPEELHIKAALLIEIGDLDSAEDVIQSSPESSETLRLLSLVASRRNDSETALVCAQEALSLSPKSYSAALTYMHACLRSAMVASFDATVGQVPSPFNSALIIQTHEAQEHLRSAIDVAERLIHRCSGSQKQDSETWKLALMVGVRGKRNHAIKFAEELVQRSKPDPLHIAWADAIYVDLPIGRLRKYLEDEVRLGRGTSAHLVVRAILNEDDQKGRANSAHIIEKHIGKFPEEQEFLTQWLEIFNSRGNDLRAQISNGDIDAAKTYAAEFRPKGDNAEAWLIYAEVLASGNAWVFLNEAQEQLLKFQIPRLHHLAALAALECNDPDRCIEIIDASIPIQYDRELPPNMEYLKARALDQSGQGGRSLSQLVDLNRRAPNAEIQRNIIHRLVALGQTQEALPFVRQLVDADDAEPRDYLIAAQISSDKDPEFSRIAAERYLSQDEVDLLAVPHLMELERKVGSFRADLSHKYRALAQEFFSSDHVTQFDSAEEVIAQLQRIQDHAKQSHEKWLSGSLTAHQAFENDYGLFAEVMFSGPHWAESDTGTLLPPLHKTAGLPARKIQLSESGKNPLVLDVSALLFAMRFGLLPELEKAFQIILPRSVPGFLNEIQNKYSPVLDSDDCRRFWEFERNFLSKVPLLPGNTTLVPKPHSNESRSVDLDRMLAQLISEGLLSEAQQEALFQDLHAERLPGEIQGPTKEYFCASGPLLWSLMRCDVLEEVQQVCELTTTSAQVAELRNVVSQSERRSQLLSELENLHTFVAKRLRVDQWKSIPWPPEPDRSKCDIQSYPEQNALLGSLWECLHYAGSKEQPLVWIEDRFLSRYNSSNIVTHHETLCGLETSGLLKSERVADVRRKILVAGVGFSEIEVERCVDALINARLADGVVKETKTLKELRLAFGRQLRLLQFIDWAENRVDEDGIPVGEPRLAKSNILFIPRMLNAIWSQKEISEDHRVAASNWVWENLRLEIARLDSDLSAEHYYSVASVVIMECFAQPLLDTFLNKEKSIDQFSGFFNWLFKHQLTARFLCDPLLRERVAKLFVEILSPRLVVEEDDESAAIVTRLFVQEVNKLIDLLPESLQDEIYSIEGFSEKLLVRREFLIKTPLGDFTCSEVGAGIERAIRAETGETVITCLEGEAKVTLSVKRQDDVIEKVVISDGKVTGDLALETAMLSVPDARGRLSLFDSVSYAGGADPEFTKRAKDILKKDITVNARIKDWRSLIESNFAETLASISENLQDGGKLDIRLLDLPSKNTLTNYSRLDGAAETPLDAIAKAYEALESVFGKQEALGRTSVLQAFLMDVDLEKLADWEPQYPNFLFESCLVYLKKNGGEKAEFPWLDDSEPTFDQQIDFFVFLVRKGIREARVRIDYSGVPDWQLVALVWVWSAQVTKVFSTNRVDLAAARKIIERSRRTSLDQVLEGDAASPTLRYGGIDLSADWCRQRIFDRLTAKIERTLSIEADADLLGVIGIVRDDSWCPSGNMLFQQVDSPDGLFSNNTSYQDWIERGLISQKGDFESAGRADFPEKLLTDFRESKNPEFLAMFLLARPGELPEAILGELTTEIESVLSGARGLPLSDNEKVLLRLYGRVTGELDSQERFCSMIADLISLRFGYSGPPELPDDWGKLETENLFAQLLDAACAHAQSISSTAQDKITRLCDLLRHVHDQWPTGHRLLHQLAMNLVDQTLVDQAQPLWCLIRDVRVET